jgi:hypothetical protein
MAGKGHKRTQNANAGRLSPVTIGRRGRPVITCLAITGAGS